MSRKQRIIDLLSQQFVPTRLEVRDDSHKHAGHAGARPEGETHFSVAIESAQFAGMAKVARHQAIYKALAAELKNGLHALAIEANAPKD